MNRDARHSRPGSGGANAAARQAAAAAAAAARADAEAERLQQAQQWLEHWAELDFVELVGLQVAGGWVLQEAATATDYEWPQSLRPPQLSAGKYLAKVTAGHVVVVQSRSGKFVAARDVPAAPVPDGPNARASAAGAGPAAAPVVPDGMFANPYNFVSFGTSYPERAAASGHDSYRADRYSGSIPVTITALTPLLLLDQSRATAHPLASSPDAQVASEWAGHKVLPLRVGPDGAPILAGSSLKGVLRSAFEAVTNSRMGVFDDQKRYALREVPKAALAKRPAVVLAGADGQRSLRVMRQADVPAARLAEVHPPHGLEPPNQGAHPIRIVPAALVPFQPNHCRPELRGMSAAGKVDRAEVCAWVHLLAHPGPRPYYAWVVSALAPDQKQLGRAPELRGRLVRSYSDCHYAAKVRGRLHITDSRFGTTKHDERLMILESLDGRIDLGHDDIPLGTADQPASLVAQWDAVIAAYAAASSEDVPRGHTPGSYRQSNYPQQWRLEPDRTLYVAVAAHQKHGEMLQERDITGLSPALIGRAPFPDAPGALVPAELLPLAVAGGDPSPADRVFGWVAGTSGYRGHLRIDPPTAQPNADGAWPIRAFPEPGFELAPLGSPKPTQFRFYVDDPGAQKVAASGYRKGARGLRGRKVYPHQWQATDWNPDSPSAAGRWVGDPQGKHKQTHSITARY